MPATPTPATTTRGCLPIGTVTEFGTIIDVSLTAYLIDVGGTSCERWVSFDKVHGTPEPAFPLVRLEWSR